MQQGGGAHGPGSAGGGVKKNFSPARIDTRVLIARKTGLGKQLSENFGKETISESFRALLSVLSKLKTRFSEFVQKNEFFLRENSIEFTFYA